MSYRELRNFTETMKCLGYHRLISMDNFRSPNFELVADILYWLSLRFDPNSDLSDDISTEGARVDFLKSAALLMNAKAHVKLNIKKLYQADGYAVKELMKISSLLYRATSLQNDDEGEATSAVDLSYQSKDLKEARSIATDIIERGSKLYTLLGNEPELKVARERAVKFIEEMSHNLESDDPQFEIERSMRSQINSLSDHIVNLETNCKSLATDQISIQAKIDRKQMEIERASKRLKSITKVKPAFMAEYEQLEAELKAVYHTYVVRFTNLHYLEGEQRQVLFLEQEKKNESERHLRKMRRQLRDEELRILRGEQQIDENNIDTKFMETDEEGSSEEEDSEHGADDRPSAELNRRIRPRGADPRGRMKPQEETGRSGVGSMAIGNSSDESEVTDLSNEESEEEDLVDGNDLEESDGEEEEEEEESDTDF